jgi:hypothetical protein
VREHLAALARWLIDRAVLTLPVGGCFVGLAAVRLLPELPGGEWVFERLALQRTWPLLPLLMGWLFCRLGAVWHRSSGRPVYAPFKATVGLLVILAITQPLLAGSASEWPWWWALIMALVVAVALFLAVRAWFAYSEVWRTGFFVLPLNRYVVQFVRDTVAGNVAPFLAATRGRRKEWQPPAWLQALEAQAGRPSFAGWRGALRWAAAMWRREGRARAHTWGSPHCLAILNRYYEELKYNLIREEQLADPADVGAGDGPAYPLMAYLDAGEVLAAYLRLDWADKALAEAAPDQVALVRREMITLALWFSRRWYGPATLPPLATKVNEWLCQSVDQTALLEHLPADFGPAEFWNGLLKDASRELTPALLSLDEERALVRRAGDLFARMSEEAATLCSLTWIALATRVPDQVRLDVWLEARRRGGLDPVEPPPGEDLDPAWACGREALRQLYARWGNQLPGAWAEGIKGQAAWISTGRLSERCHAVAVALQRFADATGRE